MKIGNKRFPFDWCYSWNRAINQLVVVGKKLEADLTQKNFFEFFMLRRLESVFQGKNFFSISDKNILEGLKSIIFKLLRNYMAH